MVNRILFGMHSAQASLKVIKYVIVTRGYSRKEYLCRQLRIPCINQGKGDMLMFIYKTEDRETSMSGIHHKSRGKKVDIATHGK